MIISNEEVNDIIKIVNSLEESGLLIKGVRDALKNEAKEQTGKFLVIVFALLGASFLENLLTGGGVKTKIPRKGVIRAGEGTIRASEGTSRAGQDL